MDPSIKTYDIKNPKVLQALNEVPRERFVPAHLQSDAYADSPLPIGHGQTISQPYIVGKMTELLDPQPEDVVLDIGGGSGYQAAVLSRIVQQVISIERIPELAEQAETVLNDLGYENVTVLCGDGAEGCPEKAPFTRILLAAAPPEIPPALLDQLAEGGTLLAPVGPAGDTQRLHLVTKVNGEIQTEKGLHVRFVPFM